MFRLSPPKLPIWNSIDSDNQNISLPKKEYYSCLHRSVRHQCLRYIGYTLLRIPRSSFCGISFKGRNSKDASHRLYSESFVPYTLNAHRHRRAIARTIFSRRNQIAQLNSNMSSNLKLVSRRMVLNIQACLFQEPDHLIRSNYLSLV
jgi:hypothetical protein